MRLVLWMPVLAAALAGCLPEGRPVKGRLLAAGREIEKPGFVAIGDSPWVTYEVRRGPGTAALAPTYDLAMVQYDTAEQRMLLQNVADRDGWRPQTDNAGVHY